MKKRLNWKAVIVALLSVVVVLGGGVYAVMQNQDIKQEKVMGAWRPLKRQLAPCTMMTIKLS